MIFDTVIIGGGLSGLACGIRLQESGKKCVIVSSGQSALHFSSGSFDLLNALPDGGEVNNPAEAIDRLAEQSPSHPYAKMGKAQFVSLSEESKQLLRGAHITTTGSCLTNHFRLTPIGLVRPAWLTMNDYVCMEQAGVLPWHSALLVSFKGYLDFHPDFFADKLRRMGMKISEKEIDLSSLDKAHRHPSEVRSANIARLFDSEDKFEMLAEILKTQASDNEAILLPACFGLERTDIVNKLSVLTGRIVKLLATFPPSVAGIRAQHLLKQRFMTLGGIYMLGDTVTHADIANERVDKIFTANHGDIPLRGEEYVLCSGSFFSQGLVALPNEVIDPICGLDIDYQSDRRGWFATDVFDAQPYESFGIKTDNGFRAIKDGRVIDNLHVCGASLGGFDALKQGCGGGVSLLTALFVADAIRRKSDI